MKRIQILIGIASLLFTFLKSNGLAAQSEAWKADWEKTIQAAKKEGQLTLYGSPDFEGLFGEFHKKYPEIKITGVFNRGADVAKRLMAERRGDKYLADLYVNGMTTGYNVFYKAKALDPIPPQLILPEVTDTSKWWRGKLHYVDPENQYLLNINGENRMVVAYNTKLVNPAEIKSYWDLLNPKWKGKSLLMIRRSADPATRCGFFIITRASARSSSGVFFSKPISSSARTLARWATGWREGSLRCRYSDRFREWIWI